MATRFVFLFLTFRKKPPVGLGTKCFVFNILNDYFEKKKLYFFFIVHVITYRSFFFFFLFFTSLLTDCICTFVNLGQNDFSDDMS